MVGAGGAVVEEEVFVEVGDGLGDGAVGLEVATDAVDDVGGGVELGAADAVKGDGNRKEDGEDGDGDNHGGAPLACTAGAARGLPLALPLVRRLGRTLFGERLIAVTSIRPPTRRALPQVFFPGLAIGPARGVRREGSTLLGAGRHPG